MSDGKSRLWDHSAAYPLHLNADSIQVTKTGHGRAMPIAWVMPK
jgi:hypothetical protein